MTRRRLRLAALAASAVWLCQPAAVGAQEGLSGAYLAARSAAIASDYREAAGYFAQALVRDPQNRQLLEFALVAEISLGRFDAALPLARRVDALGESQLANLVLMIDRVDRQDWDALIASVDETPQVGPVVDGLARAWALVGAGRMSDALATYDRLAGNAPLRVLALMNKAHALASVGDFEGAEAIFAGADGTPMPQTRRSVIAHAQVLSQIDRGEDARALLESVFGADPDREVADLRDALARDETIAYTAVTSPARGLAEVFLNVAGAISDEADEGLTLVYARAAEHLAPEMTEPVLLVAQILENRGQYDLATETLKRIPRDSPAYPAAEMGRASALRDAGRVDAAIEVLEQLAKSFPDQPSVFVAHGDMLRQEERFAEAAAAYDKGVALMGEPQPQHWPVYFARGIAHERADDWPKAEADLRQALALNPEQPAVLNYLGYSYLEKQTNFDEALGMIERAVAARPDSGAIIDSLGWALYRLGRYDEAVPVMEKAASLEAVDPVVNDHLGDAYWAVGRKLEAEFQWRRALSFEPEEVDARRIRRKLETGLDAVLAEEGAPPIRSGAAGSRD